MLLLFAHRLALTLGEPNVKKLLRSISYVQLLRWIAYDSIEPFGEIRADARSAQITAAVVNFQRALGGKRTPLPLQDFLLKFGSSSKGKQTWEEKKAMAYIIAGVTCKD